MATMSVVQTNNEITQAKKGMATYLHNKYGKEFVVENYRIEGDTFGTEGDPTADAHPKDNSILSFEIRDSGAYKKGAHRYWDDYVGVMWSEEEGRRLDKTLKNILGYLPLYSLKIHLKDGSEASEQIDKNNFPAFPIAAARYSSDISYFLSVKSNVISREKLNKLIFAREYLKMTELVQGKGFLVGLSYGIEISPGKMYGISMQNDQFSAIRDESHLIDEFKEWGRT